MHPKGATMLSDHERRTLAKIEADLGANDPPFAGLFAASDRARAPLRPRRSYPFWGIATSVALLVMLSLAAGLPGGVFFGAALVLGALVCHLNDGGEI